MHLVIIYGSLSRYDKANNNLPYSGAAGAMVKHRTLDLLPAGTTFEIRVIGGRNLHTPFPSNSRVLLLGTDALKQYNIEPNLNKHRGYCLEIPSPLTGTLHPAICTYLPIDCWDFTGEAESADDDTDSDTEDKDVAATKRANYFAWHLSDFWKLVNFAGNKWPLQYVKLPAYTPVSTEFAVNWLRQLPPETHLTLDVECRPQDHTLDCIGLRANGLTVVVPIYGPDNKLCFQSRTEFARFWRALYLTLLRPDITIVGHNLSFDLSLLALYAALPIPLRVYDTMIAMHRAEPNREKSLSHAISFYLYAARNHKADICPNTSAVNFKRLLEYNAVDLVRTEQLKAAQLSKASNNPSLLTAIQQGNDLLHVTLMMSMTGLRTDRRVTEQMRQAYQLKAQQLARCLKILTGNPNFNPSSPQQVAAFLFGQLHYPVLTQTNAGQPATGAKALYILQTKQNNPLFPLLIAYKEAIKAASSLEFKPLVPSQPLIPINK